MLSTDNTAAYADQPVEIIAFRLHDQEFCVKTTSTREIRGWAPSTTIPHSPPEMIGVMNLRGTVIPIIDLSYKLGMPATQPNERSAIVVAELHDKVIGMLVDRMSDILTVNGKEVQPVPEVSATFDTSFSDGIITKGEGMIYFLNFTRMFDEADIDGLAARSLPASPSGRPHHHKNRCRLLA